MEHTNTPNYQKPIDRAGKANLRTGSSGNNSIPSTDKLPPTPDFEPGDVSDIYDKLTNHSCALRAFGLLLKSSDLNDFADEMNSNSEQARWGLNQIIEMYLSHQDSVLSEHLDQYCKSDIVLIRQAKIVCNHIDQGAYESTNGEINALRKAIEKLDIVIKRNADLAGRAKELKGICFDYIDQLTKPVNRHQEKETALA